jgi:hypothetical protein
VYADLDLSQDDFEALYSEVYFKGEEYSDYLADKVALQKNFSSRLEILQRYTQSGAYHSLVEVGSAGKDLQDVDISRILIGNTVTPPSFQVQRLEF